MAYGNRPLNGVAGMAPGLFNNTPNMQVKADTATLALAEGVPVEVAQNQIAASGVETGGGYRRQATVVDPAIQKLVAGAEANNGGSLLPPKPKLLTPT